MAAVYVIAEDDDMTAQHADEKTGNWCKTPINEPGVGFYWRFSLRPGWIPYVQVGKSWPVCSREEERNTHHISRSKIWDIYIYFQYLLAGKNYSKYSNEHEQIIALVMTTDVLMDKYYTILTGNTETLPK